MPRPDHESPREVEPSDHQEKPPIEQEKQVPRLDVKDIPATGVRLKMLKGEQLTIAESIKAGRDSILSGEVGPGITTLSDHAYRCIDMQTLNAYMNTGGVEIDKENDIYLPGENGKGVDWYLGGFAPRYGEIVIETPARSDRFTLVESESLLGKDPNTLHVKSRGGKEAVRFGEITRIFHIKQEPTGERRVELFDLQAHKKERAVAQRKVDLAQAVVLKEQIKDLFPKS